MISQQSLNKFKELWFEHFEEVLSEAEAQDHAHRLLSLVKVVIEHQMGENKVED